MHIFFSGIGGAGIGPLALIARQAGYDVSGSDHQESAYTKQLQRQGVNLYIGQSEAAIARLHASKPIDWFVYSSAVARIANHPELQFVKQHHIPHSLRDELLNKIITDKQLKLIGIAGTHGKSTTTAMVIWLLHELGIPAGHSVGAKLPFAPMGQLPPHSEYFIYECDEFDYNFLAFSPYLAAITGVAWDHHELFSTRETYVGAFAKFIHQSQHAIMWQADARQMALTAHDDVLILNEADPHIQTITLPGEFNRLDAWLAVTTVHRVTGEPIKKLVRAINAFPGLKQRMELLAPGLYSNYAHTPEKIKGGMLTALDIAAHTKQNIYVIYEPLTNRRQHYIKSDYKDCFRGAAKVYWVPTYLAREDPNQAILSPEELIKELDDPSIAEPANMNEQLRQAIAKHIANGDMVVAMGASGAGSLDEWLRKHFKAHKD